MKDIASIHGHKVSMGQNGILNVEGIMTSIIEHPTGSRGNAGDYIVANGAGGWDWSSQSVGTLNDLNDLTDAITDSSSIYLGTDTGSDSTGSYNTALGIRASYSNKAGSNNINIGFESGYRNTSGSNNTFIGYRSAVRNTTASNNTTLGSLSLNLNKTGQNNVAIGYEALKCVGNSPTTTGTWVTYTGNVSNSTAIGTQAGKNALNNTECIYIGYSALSSNDAASNEIVIGNNVTGSGNNTITIGNSDITGLYIPGLQDSATEGDVLTFKDSKIVFSPASTTGSGSVNDLTDCITFGKSIFIGTSAGASAATASDYNVGFGYEAMKSLTEAVNNTAIGYKSLTSTTNGGMNTAIGTNALSSNSNGTYNVAIGYNSLYYNNASYTVCVGAESLDDGTETHIRNGVYLGGKITASGRNVENEIVIGYNSIGSGDNTITLGNSAITGLYIPGLQDGASTGDVLTFNGSKIVFSAPTIGTEIQIKSNPTIPTYNYVEIGPTQPVQVEWEYSTTHGFNVNNCDASLVVNGGIHIKKSSNSSVPKIDLADQQSFEMDLFVEGNCTFIGNTYIGPNGVLKLYAPITDITDKTVINLNGGVHLNTTLSVLNEDEGSGPLTYNSGTPGDVLVSQGDAKPPRWLPPSGGSSLNDLTDGITVGTSIFIGTSAGSSATTRTEKNVGVGHEAMRSVTESGNNTAVGYSALSTKTGIGSNNTAIGHESLKETTTGAKNTGLGYNSLRNNTTGFMNTAIGNTSGEKNLTGHQNVSVGSGSLRNNTSGTHNTAIGTNALLLNTAGKYNVAIGFNSVFYNNASYTVCIGAESLNDGTETNIKESVYLGGKITASGRNVENEIVIGYNTTGSGNNTITLGNSAITGLYIPGLQDGASSGDVLKFNGSKIILGKVGGGGGGANLNENNINFGGNNTSSYSSALRLSHHESSDRQLYAVFAMPSGLGKSHVLFGTNQNGTYGKLSVHIWGNLFVNGSHHNNNNWSDDRIKFNEQNITDGLDVIRQLSPEIYDKAVGMNPLIDSTNRIREVGFIAQEVAQIPQLQQAVQDPEFEDLPYSLKYNEIFTYAVAAIQELDKIVQNQAAEIAIMKSKLI